MKIAKAIFVFLFWIIVVILGLILLLLAYLSYSSESELKNWDKVSATVISVEITYNRKGSSCPHIVVQYEYRGKSYESELVTKEYPCGPMFRENEISEYQLNKNFDIYINPENPRQAKSINYRRGSFFMYVFLICGVAFVFFPVVEYIERRRRKKYLKRVSQEKSIGS